MPGLANSIDGLLSKRGSPLAGLGNVFVATGQKYGVDPRLLVGISGIESGFGLHTMGNHNAWGWGPGKSFGSWEQGISTVAQGLKSGYLDRGLLTPAQIAHRYAPGSDGNDEQNWANTVASFMKELGGNPASVRIVSSAPTTLAAPKAVPLGKASTMNTRQAALGVLGGAASRGGYINPLELLNQLTIGAVLDQRAGLPQEPPQTVLNDPGTPEKGQDFPASGNPLPKSFLSSIGGLHQTEGLAGYPAHDYFANAGSPVIAPVGGTITRFSGHDPKQGPTEGVHGPFGWSLYLRGNDGRMYYLTHMGSRSVQVGQKVKAGATIGSVGDYARWGGANHVHMGVH